MTDFTFSLEQSQTYCFGLWWHWVHKIHFVILSHPTPLCHQRALGWASCVTQQLLFYTWWCTCIWASLLIPLSLSFPASVHKSILYICIFISILQIGPQDSFSKLHLYMCVCYYTCFSLSDLLQKVWYLYKRNTTWPIFCFLICVPASWSDLQSLLYSCLSCWDFSFPITFRSFPLREDPSAFVSG